MQNGPQNGIVGEDTSVTIPETVMVEEELLEEKRAAKYSRSHEYKKLKSHWDARVEFYQKHLPNGTPIIASEKSLEELGRDWVVANTIIAELQNAMNYYENANEIVGKVDV